MTEAVHLNIVAESDKYMEVETPVGELMFKMMIQKKFINTRAMATYLRGNLTNLDT